jgi:hypothetical protein
MTTDEYLKWAKRHRCYIEIYTDGSAEVQFESGYCPGEFNTRIQGSTLRRAIGMAMAYHRRWHKNGLIRG